jgi:pilus assembly protein FimV
LNHLPTEKMRAASRGSLVVGALLSMTVSASLGMGFGRTSTNATLGQPLDFRVVLRQEADEFIDAECVSVEVTSGEESIPRPALRVSVEGPANAPERTLRVTSSVPIAEPVVQISLGVGCPPRLSRTFTAFVDPPEIRLAQQAPEPPPPAPAAPAVASAVSAPETQAAAAPAPAPRRAAARRTPRRSAPAGEAASVARATTPQPVEAASAPRRPAVVQRTRPSPAPAPGPRLQLETVQSPARAAAIEAERAASAAAQASVAAIAAADAASQAAAAEAGRIKALEDTLARLKNESQSNNEGLAALRARVAQAEAERYANPLVYALAALAALLALALLWLLLRRRQERGAWWSESQLAARADDAAQPSRLGGDSRIDSRLDASPPSVVPLPVVVETMPPPISVQPSIAPETRPAIAEPRRPVSVEELIDLEQQAEFFAVLGQDEQAIDLLMNHLRGTGGISPLPYLKLLELYRRRGEREAYERIRERFNRRFNAYAPDWAADPSRSRSLEDYPQVVARLQALWPDPQAAMDELEAMLFRRDEGETFDVPAYSELLFLYTLERDHLERIDDRVAPEMSVDILLPMGSGPPPQPAVPMLSTIPIDPHPEVEKPLSVDFDVSELPKGDNERAARYEESDFSFRTDFGDKLKKR